MKLIERFKARRIFPRRATLTTPAESKWEPWSEWIDCDGTQGLTLDECETLLTEWGYAKRFDDARIWQLVDMVGASQHRIVADNFNVESYNVALKE